MSSKSADPPDAAAPAPRRHSWSLSNRLALATSVSSFLILAIVSFLMYFQLAKQLHRQNSQYLREELETLNGMGRFREFEQMFAEEIRIDHAGEEYLTHYIRLLDSEGGTKVETPAMDKLLPPVLFPHPGKGGRPSAEVEVRKENGSSFILTSVSLNTGRSGNGKGTIQVALDVTNINRILTRYRTIFAISLPVGLLLCAVTGLLIARRGMRPVREITERAREITVASLDERLKGEDWPSELNAMADALNGMLERIQDSFSRLYNSVANLSHKLRTPLTILRGEAEITLGKERSADELREVLASSMEEYDRLSRLVDNIIFIAQAEAGKLQHVLIKIKAGAEVEKLLDYYGPLAEEKGVVVTGEGEATFAADPALFRKAVAILLSNAFTYTPSGGTITVRARQEEDGSAEIRVVDSGCGIAEQDVPKIFDRFYRVYDTRYLDPHGSGLGLSLVKTIMDLHNGTVELESHAGEGTTAILKFPYQNN